MSSAFTGATRNGRHRVGTANSQWAFLAGHAIETARDVVGKSAVDDHQGAAIAINRAAIDAVSMGQRETHQPQCGAGCDFEQARLSRAAKRRVPLTFDG
jgi:hypothetical protein